MGVDVVLKLVHQPGSSPRRRSLVGVDAVLDGADVFAGLCVRSGLPMLNRVDPYGTLILTAQDMPQFLSELDAVRGVTGAGSGREVLDAVRRLAERCAAGASMEVHLEGD